MIRRAIQNPKYIIYVKDGRTSEVKAEFNFVKKTAFAIRLPGKLQVLYDNFHEIEVYEGKKLTVYPCV